MEQSPEIRPEDVVIERVTSQGLAQYLVTIKNKAIRAADVQIEVGEDVEIPKSGTESWEACKWARSWKDWTKCKVPE
ncbi:MAG: hypothetical protein ABIF04_00685 [Chloroflexota bacterium]